MYRALVPLHNLALSGDKHEQGGRPLNLFFTGPPLGFPYNVSGDLPPSPPGVKEGPK
jgi:hypothetical protein